MTTLQVGVGNGTSVPVTNGLRVLNGGIGLGGVLNQQFTDFAIPVTGVNFRIGDVPNNRFMYMNSTNWSYRTNNATTDSNLQVSPSQVLSSLENTVNGSNASMILQNQAGNIVVSLSADDGGSSAGMVLKGNGTQAGPGLVEFVDTTLLLANLFVDPVGEGDFQSSTYFDMNTGRIRSKTLDDWATVLMTQDRNGGTFTANGGTTTYTIPHGLSNNGSGVIPKGISVVAGSANAAALFYVSSITDTNIVVTYLASTTAGTNNISLRWFAIA